MSNNVDVLLIGAGYMGREYYKVLDALALKSEVVCRSEKTAQKFEMDMGKRVLYGNLTEVLYTLECPPKKAIVAVNVECLKNVVVELLNSGVKSILVEKPAGMNTDEIRQIVEKTQQNEAEVFVAYNRRFYASTEKALEIILDDGGVSSFNFEFTEWSSSIESSDNSREVKEEWLLANSSHVIDLAFFLGGYPAEMVSFQAGALNWHHRASRYSGAGRTDKGTLFSYQANWEAPGRWGVEVMTSKHRIYMRPMEKLFVQNINSLNIEPVELDDSLERLYKPGLFKQTEAFISNVKDGRLVTIQEQLKHMDIYEKIDGGQ